MRLGKLFASVAPIIVMLALEGCGSGFSINNPQSQGQQAATPTFSVAAGSYSTTQRVTIASSTSGSTIFYTTDGTTPTTSSNVYSGAVPVSTTQTIKAIATANGYTTSAVASATYSMSGSVSLSISDDPTEDWATIGVKVESVALVPAGGGSNVTIYSAPSSGAPALNLVQLDGLSEILGGFSVPTGTYSKAVLTVGANNSGTTCDVSLIVSPDPETGFPLAPGSTVPCSQIVVNGAIGTSPNATAQVTVGLASPLNVTTANVNALNLEFDLRHPALIVEHQSATDSQPFWVVNFQGPVRHHPRADLTGFLLRHMYGEVPAANGISSDNAYINVGRVVPVHPITSPETATADSGNPLAIYADSTNGTIFDDLDDTNGPTTVHDFSTLATTLPGMYVRIAARYSVTGILTATRIYASKTFDNIWRNPEGHVVHVNTNTNVMCVTTEDGKLKQIGIGPNTNFYFGSDNTVIGTGPAFFDGTTPGKLPNVARGFKVNVTIDPLSTATPPVAESVEIDVARYDGAISSSNSTGFEYGRAFADADALASDGYSGTLDYISSQSSTLDQVGASVNGFYWWDFGFPTLEDTGANAVTDFVNATGNYQANLGGGYPLIQPTGMSHATWNDQAAPGTWSAIWTVLLPGPMPIGFVSTAFSSSTDSLTYIAPPPTANQNPPALKAVTIDLTTTSGGATLVYQVSRQGKVFTVTPQDISNPATLTAVGGQLVPGVPVKVFGVPQSDGSIKAYTLFYYTGTLPATN